MGISTVYYGLRTIACATRRCLSRNVLGGSIKVAARTKPPELVQSGAWDKGGLIPTIAGNNGDNYLIIPAASTAPTERVTGVQQCLCCK